MITAPERLDLLDPKQKRDLLARLLKERASRSGEEFELSSGQEALWFLQGLLPDSAAYNIAFCVRVNSHIDTDRLESSLLQLLERHPMLRCTIISGPDGPRQRIGAVPQHCLELVDCSGCTDEELLARVDESHRRPFDLANGPVFRATLFSRNRSEHVLLLDVHHAVSDAASTGILGQDLMTLYEKGPAELAPLPGTYSEFVNWQRATMESEEGHAAWDYWRARLEHLPSDRLPTDHPRPKMKSFRGATHHFALSAALCDQVRELARAQNTTPFVVLAAAFHATLHRYSGYPMVPIGTPLTRRVRREFEQTVGYFINPVVLCAPIQPGTTFRQHVSDMREASINAQRHGDFPFPELVKRLQPQRDESGTPLFQVTLNLIKATQMGVVADVVSSEGELPRRAGSLALQSFPLNQQEGLFDLDLGMFDTGGAMPATLKYSTDLFEPSSIERMAGHFVTLLSGATANPDQRLSELPLLTAAERKQILVDWNATDQPYTEAGRSLHELVEGQVDRTPDAIAVVSEKGTVTYRELDSKATRIAQRLRKLGIGRGALVAVCLGRSVELIAGMLGILKSGAAFVPIDPTYPPDRIAYMLEDACVSAVLGQSDTVANLRNRQVPVVLVDDHSIANEPSERLQCSPSPESPAYVIYTSGSTGKPKGVMIHHRAIVNHVLWMRTHWPMGLGDAVLQSASPSFDASVWEIWNTLAGGARLVLGQSGGYTDPAYLTRCILEHKITHALIIPSVLEMVARHPDFERCQSLRCLFSGAEALKRSVVDLVRSRLNVEVVNLYGPTEATINATYWVTEPVSGLLASMEPIGRPIGNARIYILNAANQPVPVGVAGELHIGGAGVGLGYLRRPELTAEKFIAEPFVPGGRLYKTGDLARFRADGVIEYLGRIDHQVKVRGHRIELGEIESVLAQHPGVKQAVVAVREDNPGDQRIVAYLISRDATAPDLNDVRTFAASKLPDYMLPAAVMILEAFPLMPNGKVDRKALPALSPQGQARRELSLPRTRTEEILVQLWKDVLKTDEVGVTDNFFDLGGHSLLVMSLQARIRKQFNREVAVLDLFQRPTVRDIARELEMTREDSTQQFLSQLHELDVRVTLDGERLSIGAPKGVVTEALKAELLARKPEIIALLKQVASQGALTQPIPRVDGNGELPISYQQKRLWFMDQFNPNSAVYNIGGGLRLRGELNRDALERALRCIVERHAVLRTRFLNVDGSPKLEIGAADTWTMPVVDLRHVPDAQLETEFNRVLREDLRQPFNLAHDALFRASLLVLRERDHVLSIVMHHIASDGWSIGVFIRELAELYPAFHAGQPSPLPELPVQYVDYAAWHRQWLESGVLERELSYWKQQLRRPLPLLEIPADHARPQVQSTRGALVKTQLPDQVCATLKKVAKAENTTLFIVLLAVFKILLHRYTGLEDIVVGTVNANRNRPDLGNLIGFFVNNVVIRTPVSGATTGRELLRRVHDVVLDAFEHQNVPFDVLVDAIQPQRDLTHSPLFQTMFVLHNYEIPSLEIPGVGLTVERVEVDPGTARFDLTVDVLEKDGSLEVMSQYNTDLFDESSVVRMQHHFRMLIEAIAKNLDCPIAELPMISNEERKQLAVWNSNSVEYPRDCCIHELIEAQAKRTPSRVAVEFEGRTISFDALTRSSRRLARALGKVGVGPESLVGICMERSVDMVIAVLGVLQAGAAYVPLDPGYPPERTAFIMRDAKLALMLTEEAQLSTLPEQRPPVLCLDRDWASIAAEDDSPLARIAGPETVAYVLYTSGSTGQPKGVQVEHRSVVNFLESMRREPGLGEGDCLVSVTSLSFDIAGLEIYLPLMVGARLVLASRDVAMDGVRLGELLRTSCATVMQATPSTWRVLLQSGWESGYALKALCGGEALPGKLAEEMLAAGFELWNLYGPTETTIWSTVHKVMAGEDTVSIGHPIANTSVYILDRNGQPVPVNVPGELFIGGDGLARGYLHRADLTAERFVPDPFQPGGRMYKTGDLARRRANGDIDYLGRMDRQVKIRGHRIELGEIESVLSQHSEVGQGVVVAREDTPGDQRLVAYFTLRGAQTAEMAQLKSFLAAKLPDYMVPSAFVPLESFPLTPNGKVDVRALPAPSSSMEPSRDFVAPESEAEQLMAELWKQVLKTEQIGVNDNFFDRGGHSLLVVELQARIRKQFNRDVSLVELFQRPTVRTMASLLSGRGQSDGLVQRMRDRARKQSLAARAN